VLKLDIIHAHILRITLTNGVTGLGSFLGLGAGPPPMMGISCTDP